MNKNRLLIEIVPADKLKDIQQKLNTWMTTGLLVKYKTSVVGLAVLFEIVLRKEP